MIFKFELNEEKNFEYNFLKSSSKLSSPVNSEYKNPCKCWGQLVHNQGPGQEDDIYIPVCLYVCLVYGGSTETKYKLILKLNIKRIQDAVNAAYTHSIFNPGRSSNV